MPISFEWQQDSVSIDKDAEIDSGHLNKTQQVRVPKSMKEAIRVAIVDDDFRILESLDDLLAAAGYEVMPFASAELFLEADCTNLIACLISDIGMPQMNGWDLMRTVRVRRSDLPIILITGREDERTTADVQRKGFRLFCKPFDGAQLLQALATLIVVKK